MISQHQKSPIVSIWSRRECLIVAASGVAHSFSFVMVRGRLSISCKLSRLVVPSMAYIGYASPQRLTANQVLKSVYTVGL